jgi:hypothetical protein
MSRRHRARQLGEERGQIGVLGPQWIDAADAQELAELQQIRAIGRERVA